MEGDDALQKLRELSESYGEILSDCIASGVVTQSSARGITQSLNSFISDGHKRTEGYSKRNYASKQFAISVIELMLDSDLRSKEALYEAATKLGQDDQWLREVKHSRFLHSRAVSDHFKSHPIQKDMISRKILRSSELAACDTLSKLVRKEENALDLYKKIVECEKRIKQLEEDSDRLHKENIFIKAAIEKNGLPTKHEYAMKLLEEGIGPTEVAKELNINRRTVYKWRDKELK